MQKLIAANDKIIVKMITGGETTTDSGIVLQSSATSGGYDRAKAISIGFDVKSKIKEGDTVIFKEGTSYPFPVEGNEFRIVADNMVLAILRD